uniref:Uncharacterized protein n=1 Tax=Panagrolaimus davidi TaxID=227884 RepID=A0A914QB94_9BILA
MELLHKITAIIKQGKINNELCEYLPLFGHRISNTIVNAAAAAYTSSIEKYDGVNEVCKQLLQATQTFMKDLKEFNFQKAVSKSLPEVEEKLQNLSDTIRKLPTLLYDTNPEQFEEKLKSDFNGINKAFHYTVEKMIELKAKSMNPSENLTAIKSEFDSLFVILRNLLEKNRHFQHKAINFSKNNTEIVQYCDYIESWAQDGLSEAIICAQVIMGDVTFDRSDLTSTSSIQTLERLLRI